ncbi:MAG: hypothetical protein JWO33_2188 [Caulobacteraceae bacterium]|nr:hypothetical protein [Caulobacteraceae bacterium]
MADGGLPPETSWWAAWPGLYEAELAAFERHGAAVTVAHKAGGLLILEVAWPDGQSSLPLRIGYSPLHPFFRPSVGAPTLQLQRHQHPLDAGLCLITQGSGEWRSSQKVADFIAEQLPKVYAANAARAEGRLEEAAQLEEQAPDPLSSYYAHLAADDSAIFFAAGELAPKGTVGFAHFEVGSRASAPGAFEAVLRKTEPATGSWLGKTFMMPLADAAPQKVEGRWVRMTPPATSDVQAILADAEAVFAKATILQPAQAKRLSALGKAERTITGIVFKEELGYGPASAGDGWLFIASSNEPDTGKRINVLVRGYRIGGDLQARVPVAAALASKKVLLVGAGAIGSFAGLELARAGIKNVDIVDFDVVEPGNSVRWPLGRPVWGVRKVVALKDFIERNYPNVEVRASELRIGGGRTEALDDVAPGDNPLTVLNRLILGADIVVDASASTECHEALAYACRRLGKPMVLGYATEGAAGGVVARFPADGQACYVCFQEHWRDTDFPKPSVDPAGTITPVGCNQPTFTGSAFDLQEVALELTRSAVGLLAPEVYDPGAWRVAVLSLMEDGRRTLPQWRPAMLAPRCDECKPE